MPTPPDSHRADDTLYTYLLNHHAYLERLFDEVLEAARVSAPDLGQLWTTLDHAVLAHMEAEERYVLPTFARFDQKAAVKILQEHGEIRVRLLELGVAVDLHEIRDARCSEFIALLRAHAAGEEKLLYRWADANLDGDLRAAVRHHAEEARPVRDHETISAEVHAVGH